MKLLFPVFVMAMICLAFIGSSHAAGLREEDPALTKTHIAELFEEVRLEAEEGDTPTVTPSAEPSVEPSEANNVPTLAPTAGSKTNVVIQVSQTFTGITASTLNSDPAAKNKLTDTIATVATQNGVKPTVIITSITDAVRRLDVDESPAQVARRRLTGNGAVVAYTVTYVLNSNQVVVVTPQQVISVFTTTFQDAQTLTGLINTLLASGMNAFDGVNTAVSSFGVTSSTWTVTQYTNAPTQAPTLYEKDTIYYRTKYNYAKMEDPVVHMYVGAASGRGGKGGAGQATRATKAAADPKAKAGTKGKAAATKGRTDTRTFTRGDF